MSAVSRHISLEVRCASPGLLLGYVIYILKKIALLELGVPAGMKGGKQVPLFEDETEKIAVSIYSADANSIRSFCSRCLA
jgi:hypothetical protein